MLDQKAFTVAIIDPNLLSHKLEGILRRKSKSEPYSVTVAITDPDALERRTICEALSGNYAFLNLKVVWEAAVHTETLQKLEKSAPDVLIISSTRCDYELIDFIQAISQHFQETRMLLIAPAPDSLRRSFELFNAGLRGHVLREDVSPLPHAVTTLLHGGFWLSESVKEHARQMLGSILPARQVPNSTAFTPRELEIIEFMVKGCCNGQIARTLEISQRTVREHVCHICDKLGVDSPLAAVLKLLGKIE